MQKGIIWPVPAYNRAGIPAAGVKFLRQETGLFPQSAMFHREPCQVLRPLRLKKESPFRENRSRLEISGSLQGPAGEGEARSGADGFPGISSATIHAGGDRCPGIRAASEPSPWHRPPLCCGTGFSPRCQDGAGNLRRGPDASLFPDFPVFQQNQAKENGSRALSGVRILPVSML